MAVRPSPLWYLGSADSGKTNAVVLLRPGIGHFYAENMHPFPCKEPVSTCGAIWPSKRPSLPAHGLWRDKQAHRLPGCCLTVLTGPRQCVQWKFYLLLAVQRDVSSRISSPTSVGLGLDKLILGIEPSTLTRQGNSCLALSAKFRLGLSRFLRGRWGSACLGFLMALIGTKQSSLLQPADELL